MRAYTLLAIKKGGHWIVSISLSLQYGTSKKFFSLQEEQQTPVTAEMQGKDSRIQR
jgi:hypothetical protein